MNETGPHLRPPARQAPFALQVDAYDFVFRDLDATKTDVVKPGFFNLHRSELIVGTMIDCRLGDPQDGIKRFMVQVIECPQRARVGDVLVSVGDQHGRFTPVRHDGTLGEGKPKERNAA